MNRTLFCFPTSLRQNINLPLALFLKLLQSRLLEFLYFSQLTDPQSNQVFARYLVTAIYESELKLYVKGHGKDYKTSHFQRVLLLCLAALRKECTRAEYKTSRLDHFVKSRGTYRKIRFLVVDAPIFCRTGRNVILILMLILTNLPV